MKWRTRKSKHNRVQSDDDNDDFGSSFDIPLSNSISFQGISVFENEIIKFSSPLFLAFTVRFELIKFSTRSGRKILSSSSTFIAPTRGWKTDIHFHSPIYFNELQSEIKIKYNDDDDRHTMNSLHANWQRSSLSLPPSFASQPHRLSKWVAKFASKWAVSDAHQLFGWFSCRLISMRRILSLVCMQCASINLFRAKLPSARVRLLALLLTGSTERNLSLVGRVQKKTAGRPKSRSWSASDTHTKYPNSK